MVSVRYGEGKTKFGPGVLIELTGEELAIAISSFLVAHNINIDGPRTIRVNGELCDYADVYVDPSGRVFANGKTFSGRGVMQSDDREELEIKYGLREEDLP